MKGFRFDINALRAIAVISVVIFHYFPALLPGGFIGVDVFFVISGYLMTSIILTRLEKGGFSFLDFYLARTRRIVPALIVLCSVLYIFSVFLVAPYDLQIISTHITATVFFVSNIMYWFEDGYFAAASSDKWLLHTWSLSAEWQFYLLYPVVIWAMHRWLNKKQFISLFCIGFLLLLGFSIYASRNWVSASYFLLPTRIWELMLGGFAYFLPHGCNAKYKNHLQIFGFLLLLTSCFFIDESFFWPGEFALLPTLGALFVLIANAQQSRVVRAKVLNWLGERSYSIYLWHWPIYVALGYFWEYTVAKLLVAIVITLFAAHISYVFIENPFRKKKTLYYSILIFAIGAISGCSFYSMNKTAYMDKAHLEAVETVVNDRNYPSIQEVHGIKVRKIGQTTDDKVLFIGDSVIEHLSPRVLELSDQKSIKQTWFLTSGGCVPMKEVIRPKWDCTNIKSYREILDEHFQRVVIGGLWPAYLYSKRSSEMFIEDTDGVSVSIKTDKGRQLFMHSLGEFIAEIKNTGAEVFLILDHPWGAEFDPIEIHRRCGSAFSSCSYPLTVNRMAQEERYHDYRKEIQTVAREYQVQLIDPIDFFCEVECPITAVDGRAFYLDQIHFRSSFSSKSAGFIDFVVLND